MQLPAITDEAKEISKRIQHVLQLIERQKHSDQVMLDQADAQVIAVSEFIHEIDIPELLMLEDMFENIATNIEEATTLIQEMSDNNI